MSVGEKFLDVLLHLESVPVDLFVTKNLHPIYTTKRYPRELLRCVFASRFFLPFPLDDDFRHVDPVNVLHRSKHSDSGAVGRN